MPRKKTTKKSTTTSAKTRKTAVRKKSTRGRKKSVSKMPNQNRFEIVQSKAYEIFAKRGCSHGDDLNDWYQAEKMVEKEFARK